MSSFRLINIINLLGCLPRAEVIFILLIRGHKVINRSQIRLINYKERYFYGLRRRGMQTETMEVAVKWKFHKCARCAGRPTHNLTP
jgi:hypothetical protein